MEERTCGECGNVIEEDDEYHVTEDGTILCEWCFHERYSKCDQCGEITLEDDLQFWGDCRICPKCMEEHCPDFDKTENEEETEEAYQEMREKYIGRRIHGYNKGEHHLKYTDNNGETDISYGITITVDQDGRITEISRLQAEMLFSESLTSSKWDSYPIEDYDYEWVIEEMLDEWLEEDEDWFDEDEDRIEEEDKCLEDDG